MTISGSLDPALVVVFLMAVARSTAWLIVTPPFGTTLVPVRVRVALGVGLAFMMVKSVTLTDVPLDPLPLSIAIAYQASIGLTLGFVVQLMFAAFQAAGSIIDFASGFSMGAVYDPISGGQNSTVSRGYNLIATTILFVTGGHVLIVGGFMRSFRAAPIAGPSVEALTEMLRTGLGVFLISAIQIAFPIAAAMMMTEFALALLARAAPQSNVLMIGLSLKSLVMLLLLGAALVVLPHAVSRFANDAFVIVGG